MPIILYRFCKSRACPNLGVIAFGNLRNTLSQVAFTLILTKVDKAIWLALLKAHWVVSSNVP
jgi:hypothetical protein